MSELVLLHGSWLGGWAWDEVRAHLEAAGHHTAAPTLDGKDSLYNHVDRVVDLAADLNAAHGEPVTLVPHSYSGMVATEAARRRPDLIAKVVYLDAYVPRGQQCALDVLPDIRAVFEQTAGPDGIVPPLPMSALGIDDPDLASRVTTRLQPWHLLTHQQEAGSLPADVPHSYVQLARSRFFDKLVGDLTAEGWSVELADLAHMAPVTHPKETAEAILRHI